VESGNGKVFRQRNLYAGAIVLGFIGDFVKIEVMSSFRTLFLSAIMLILFQSTVSADTGIPMICVIEPMLIFVLIPVIIVESVVMARIIKSVKFSKILRITSVSNIISTLIGFPIMWGLMAMVQIITFGTILSIIIFGITLLVILLVAAKYFGGLSKISMVILAMILLAAISGAPWITEVPEWVFWLVYLALMIPFFFVSYWIEYAVTKSHIKVFNPKEEQKTIKVAVLKANIVSYIMLLATAPFVLKNLPSELGPLVNFLFDGTMWLGKWFAKCLSWLMESLKMLLLPE
jgi:hypothetical protein